MVEGREDADLHLINDKQIMFIQIKTNKLWEPSSKDAYFEAGEKKKRGIPASDRDAT